jgi:hypothetical protein
MKRIKSLIAVLSIMSYYQSYSQNLVLNPSFEEYFQCPNGLIQLDRCKYWESFGNTPDYFNACATNGVTLPNSVFGFQYAHNGAAVAGLIPYRIPTSPDGPNYREFIGSQLVNNLIIGQKYFFSFYVNYSFYHPNQAMACNNLGLLFSTVSFNTNNPPPLNNFANIHESAILTDTVNWIKVSASFVADSAYEFVILGNFFDDQHTDTLSFTSAPDSPYYYIDDVCVTTDSIYNEIWTSSFGNALVFDYQFLYPTLSSGIFHIGKIPKQIQVFNTAGQFIYEYKEFSSNVIDLSFLNSDLYIIHILYNDQKISNQKILIQKKL